MTIPLIVATIELLLVAILVARRVDVRLVLLLGSIPLFATAGSVGGLVAKVAGEMANPGTVVPIGAALGFAYVLRETGCDRHLVRLLLLPVRKARALLVPGAIAAGYFVNTTIVSQAGTAAVLGPILLPLLRAGGLGPAQAGAVLLLGSSMGGELFNPGAVEMRKLAELTGRSGNEVVSRSAGLNLMACSGVTLAFWLLSRRRARDGRTDAPADEPKAEVEAGPTRPLRAMVPVLPILLLFSDPWLGSLSPLRGLEGPPKILAAVLLGVVAAGAVCPASIPRLAPSFFEGTGYAYTHVISLIVAASTFAEGIRLSGLMGLAVRALADRPTLALVVGGVAPWILAVISGTGIAPAVSIMEFFVPVADSIGLDPVRLGTVASLGAHFGRTMSPAAAVVMVCSTLAGVPVPELIGRVVPPLLVGGAVLLALAVLGLA